MGRVFLQLSRCTWTTVPLRSRPVPCSLEKTTNQSPLAQVRLQTGLHLAPYQCRQLYFSTQVQVQLQYVTHFIIYSMSSCFTANVISPFLFVQLEDVSPSSLCYDSDTISNVWHMELCSHAFVSPDHLTVSVAIKVNGTSVVSGSFIIYDCERTGAIHPKTSWVTHLLSQLFISNFWFIQSFVKLGQLTAMPYLQIHSLSGWK